MDGIVIERRTEQASDSKFVDAGFGHCEHGGRTIVGGERPNASGDGGGFCLIGIDQFERGGVSHEADDGGKVADRQFFAMHLMAQVGEVFRRNHGHQRRAYPWDDGGKLRVFAFEGESIGRNEMVLERKYPGWGAAAETLDAAGPGHGDGRIPWISMTAFDTFDQPGHSVVVAGNGRIVAVLNPLVGAMDSRELRSGFCLSDRSSCGRDRFYDLNGYGCAAIDE